MRSALSLIVVLLVVATAATGEGDTKLSRETLRGLKGVGVLVGHLDPEAELYGLDARAIQTDVELKLRQAGIKALTEPEAFVSPGMSWLFIRVFTANSPEPLLFSYIVIVELRQPARLERDPSLRLPGAVTWSSNETVGWVHMADGTLFDKRSPPLRTFSKDQVDKFINAYLSVNPK